MIFLAIVRVQTIRVFTLLSTIGHTAFATTQSRTLRCAHNKIGRALEVERITTREIRFKVASQPIFREERCGENYLQRFFFRPLRLKLSIIM